LNSPLVDDEGAKLPLPREQGGPRPPAMHAATAASEWRRRTADRHGAGRGPMENREMAEITAGMVKALREKTDAPMMECKKALAEADGDMDKAEELLRVRLGNKASKAASRVAAEGVVATFVAPDAALGSIIEVNCETDFVAKNEDFLIFARNLAELVARNDPADVTALSALSIGGAGVEETRKALVGRIGENVSIRRFARLQAKGRLTTYVHGGAKIGAIVDLVGGDEILAKDIAMHIAASKPVSLSRDEVPAELIQKERDIAQQKAAESGKPANIVDKMVEGSVQKFLKEVTLLGQPFVKDDKQTVEQLLKSKGAQVARFVLYVVGEGIERRQSDFAAEVMAQASLAR
jgi:elongation factor Ts